MAEYPEKHRTAAEYLDMMAELSPTSMTSLREMSVFLLYGMENISLTAQRHLWT